MFNLLESANCLEATFSAELNNIDKASAVTKHFLETTNINYSSFDILLVMREALNNAVIHGCHRNTNKNVLYRVKLDQNELAIEVEDEGDGFDWRAIMKREPQPDWDHGRGFPILKHYCDHIYFNEKGNQLIIKIKIS